MSFGFGDLLPGLTTNVPTTKDQISHHFGIGHSVNNVVNQIPTYIPYMPTQRDITWPGSTDYVNPFQSLLQPPNPLQSYNVQPSSPTEQMQSANTNLFLQLLAQRLGRR